MNNLIAFVQANSGGDPEFVEVDMMLTKVRVRKDASPVALRTLIAQCRDGEFADCNPLDGEEHNFIELGGWIGDQGLALRLMAIGSTIGLWQLLTPRSVFGPVISESYAMALAGYGLLSIQSRRPS